MPWDMITKSLGLSEGGIVRNGFEALLAALGLEASSRSTAQQSATFTIAFIALAAKMAKADGCVSPIEAETFARLYEVRPEEELNVKRVFDLAAGDAAGFETYARQIARALADEPALLRDVFDGLFHIAAADGILHPAEDAFLRRVAGIFSIPAVEFASIRSAFVRDGSTSDNPYGVLGLDRAVSDAALKARYYQLVRDLHPDSLAGRGVPAEFHAASDRRLAGINAAYDEIVKLRGLRQSGPTESASR